MTDTQAPIESTAVELVPAHPVVDVLVRPADLTAVVANQKAYLALCEALLEPSDYQVWDGGSFKKKSAWRKLNVAFNVSCDLDPAHPIERNYDDRGRLIRATVYAVAIAPNGRRQSGIGVCDVHERHSTTGNYKCPPECDGFKHFNKPEHDILATAHTRATNRASSDLYGMGEVSAEEVDGKQAARFDAAVALEPFMTPDVRPGLAEWRKRKRYGNPSSFTPTQVAEALVEVGRILERLEHPPCDDQPDEAEKPAE